MAKELPYFKFEPSEWQNGTIQMFEPEIQIAFINICCAYWQRLGDLPYAFALRAHCGGNTEIIQALIYEGVIDENDGYLGIKFLDKQLKDRNEKSKKASISARSRWQNKDPMRTHSERNANGMPEEKRREEKKREEKSKEENKEKKSTPPSIFEFTEYAKDKAVERNMNLDENKLALKYESWKENSWRTGKGTKIKNWKATLLNTLPYLQKENNQSNQNTNESVMSRLSKI